MPLWQRLTVGAVGAAFPDVDFVVSLYSPLSYLMHHRGATHSILLLPVWAWLLAWIAARAFRNPRGWRAYYAISAMSVGLHILGDLITSFGTIVFAPFSDARFEWGTTFIIDLWFSGIIIAGLLGTWAWRRSRAPAVAGCALLVAYILFQAWQKNEAIAIGRDFASRSGIAGAEVTALPRAASPYHWTAIVGDAAGYRYANIHVGASDAPPPAGEDAGLIALVRAQFQPRDLATWQSATRFGTTPDDRKLAEEAWRSDVFEFYRWFSQYPAFLGIERAQGTTCVWFRDLRFDSTGVRREDPFRMGVCREVNAPWRLHRLTAAGRVPFH